MTSTTICNRTGATRLYRQMAAPFGWSNALVGDGAAKRTIPVVHDTTRRPQEASH